MNLVDEYIESLTGNRKELVEDLVHFMRQTYPAISENFNRKMPTYEGDGFYIAFVAHSSYFSFYTSEKKVFPLIKELSPSASFGKTCARIKYSERAAYEILKDVIKEIIDYHEAQKSESIIDFDAMKKWNGIPVEGRKMLVKNVYCRTCGVTEIIDYTLHNDRLGIALKGKCKTCGDKVVRFVEDE